MSQDSRGVPRVRFIGGGYTDRLHAAWMCTVAVERRRDLQAKLRDHRIELDQVHYRNDRYAIFGSRRDNLPNMDAIEDKYLVLPLHTKMTESDVGHMRRHSLGVVSLRAQWVTGGSMQAAGSDDVMRSCQQGQDPPISFAGIGRFTQIARQNRNPVSGTIGVRKRTPCCLPADADNTSRNAARFTPMNPSSAQKLDSYPLRAPD